MFILTVFNVLIQSKNYTILSNCTEFQNSVLITFDPHSLLLCW